MCSFLRSILPGGAWWSFSDDADVDIFAKPVTVTRSYSDVGLVSQDSWVIFAAFSALIVAALSEITIPHYLTASIFSAQSGVVAVFRHNVKLLVILCVVSGICRSKSCIDYVPFFFNSAAFLKEMMIVDTKRTYFSEDNISHIGGGSVNLNGLEYQLPAAQPFSSNMNQGYNEAKHTLPKTIGFPPKVSPESIHSNFSEISPAEDDYDVCIIEEISDPAPTHILPVVSNTRYPATLNRPLAVGSNTVSSQQSSDHNTGVGGMRFRTRDEQLILRVALQRNQMPYMKLRGPSNFVLTCCLTSWTICHPSSLVSVLKSDGLASLGLPLLSSCGLCLCFLFPACFVAC